MRRIKKCAKSWRRGNGMSWFK